MRRENTLNIEQYITAKHVELIDQFMAGKKYEDALDALGRLAEFYLGLRPTAVEDEDWK